MFRDRREEIARQLRRSEEGLAAAQEEESAIARLREENQKAVNALQEDMEKAAAIQEAGLRKETQEELTALEEDLKQELEGMRLDMLRDAERAALRKLASMARQAFSQEPFASEFRRTEPEIAQAIMGCMHISPGDRVYLKQHDVLYVTLSSAYPLEESLAERIQQAVLELVGREGGKTSYRVQVDPELIGGLRLRIGDTVYDGTVANVLWNLSSLAKRGT